MRDLDVISKELEKFRNRRDLRGYEDRSDKWRRENLEKEERIARGRAQHRNLTDAEMARWQTHVQELVTNGQAATEALFAREREVMLNALGDALGHTRADLRDEIRKLKSELRENVADLWQAQHQAKDRAKGDHGAPGEKGDPGERGPSGQQGPPGEASKPGANIIGWQVDRTSYTATPILSDGNDGPALRLRELFEQFVIDAR